MFYSQFTDIFYQTYLSIHDTQEQNSKGNPIFSGSGKSMSPSAILSDLTGSWKFKMAAVKPEVLLSQPLDKIATPFQRLTQFQGSSNSAALLRILPDATGSRILKMAATKPEVLISQPLDKIVTSGLTAAILYIRLPFTSGSIRSSAVAPLTFWTQKWGLAVGTALLSCPGADI